MTTDLVSHASRKKYDTLTQKKRQEAVAGYIFMAPALVIFLIFLILPVFFAIYVSLTDWNGITPFAQKGAFSFIGLNNYSDILLESGNRQRIFFISLKNTVYFVLGVVPVRRPLP